MMINKILDNGLKIFLYFNKIKISKSALNTEESKIRIQKKIE